MCRHEFLCQRPKVVRLNSARNHLLHCISYSNMDNIVTSTAQWDVKRTREFRVCVCCNYRACRATEGIDTHIHMCTAQTY